MSERHEGVVRMDSQMWSIICEMNALLAHMEGMKADNQQNIIERRDLPFLYSSFNHVAEEFDKLAKRLREI